MLSILYILSAIVRHWPIDNAGPFMTLILTGPTRNGSNPTGRPWFNEQVSASQISVTAPFTSRPSPVVHSGWFDDYALTDQFGQVNRHILRNQTFGWPPYWHQRGQEVDWSTLDMFQCVVIKLMVTYRTTHRLLCHICWSGLISRLTEKWTNWCSGGCGCR